MANFKVRTEKFGQVCAAINLVGPGGFEPPTSTMSRLKALTSTRKDTVKIAVGALPIETMENI